jgi:hypothetical protein
MPLRRRLFQALKAKVKADSPHNPKVKGKPLEEAEQAPGCNPPARPGLLQWKCPETPWADSTFSLAVWISNLAEVAQQTAMP